MNYFLGKNVSPKIFSVNLTCKLSSTRSIDNSCNVCIYCVFSAKKAIENIMHLFCLSDDVCVYFWSKSEKWCCMMMGVTVFKGKKMSKSLAVRENKRVA